MPRNPSATEDVRRIDAVLLRTRELHSAPQVAHSILRLTRDADYDLGAVVECLESDPALASRILRLVNSSQYGLAREVTSLRQAVAYLGQRTIRMVSLSFCLIDAFARGAALRTYQNYWRRSLTMASVAARLGAQTRGTSRNDAYTAGLLADLGVLVLAQAEPDYVSVCDQTTHHDELVAAEQYLFGFDHGALAARLMEGWGFPMLVVEAIADHHHHREPERPAATALERVVRAADLVSSLMGEPPRPGRMAVGQEWLRSNFQLDTDGLLELVIRVKDDVETQSEIFGIRFSEPCDLSAFQAQLAADRGARQLTLLAEGIRSAGEESAGPSDRVEDSGAHDAVLPAAWDGPAFPSPRPAHGSARHLGHAVVQLHRETDPLRQPIPAELVDATPVALRVRLPQPLAQNEFVRVQIQNEVQRYAVELRGVVRLLRRCERDGAGTEFVYDAAVELLIPMRSPDLAALHRAGAFDDPLSEPIWLS